MPIDKPFTGTPRACVAHLFANPMASPAELLELVKAGLGERAPRLKDKKQGDNFHLRYEVACFQVCAEELGLLVPAGYKNLDDFCQKHWADVEALRSRMQRDYRMVVRKLPEAVCLGPGAGINLLGQVARRQDGCRAWLGELIREQKDPKAIWRAIRAAAQAEKQKQSDQEALARAQAALTRRQAAPASGTRVRKAPDRRNLDRDAAAEVLPRREEVLPRPETVTDAAGPPASGTAAEVLPQPAEVLPEANEGPVFVAARRPSRRTPFEEQLAIPYPRTDPAPTPSERHACAVILINARLMDAIHNAMEQHLRQGDRVNDALQLHCFRAVSEYVSELVPLRQRIQEGAAAGKADLQALQRECPDVPWLDLLPVPIAQDAQIVPQAWVSVSIIDPQGDQPDPSTTERDLWRILGLLEAGRRELASLIQCMDQEHPLNDDLLYQLDTLALLGIQSLLKVRLAFRKVGRAAQELEQAQQSERASRIEQIERADQQMVVFGSSTKVAQHAKLGLLMDGRHAALAMDRAQAIVALGGLGYGKSYLGVLLIECMLLALQGLSRISRRGVPIVFATDFRKGHTRHQHLCGLDPNPNAAQWQWLRQYFHIHFAPHMAVLKRVILYVPPGTGARYRALYPDLLERGLEVREIRLHPGEWTSFGYKAMMGGAAGKGRAQYQAFTENLVAMLGEAAHPLLVLEEFKESGLGGGSKKAMETILSLMNDLTSGQEHFSSVLEEEDALVVVLLESAWLGQDLILPMQMVLMNALIRAAAQGLPLLFVLEEWAKQAVDETTQEFLGQLFSELRHGLNSFFVGAQKCSDLPPKAIMLATGVAQFGGCSPADWRRLVDLRQQAGAVPYAEIAAMGRRVARMMFSEATDERLVQVPPQMIVRPSCIWAGGETMTTG